MSTAVLQPVVPPRRELRKRWTIEEFDRLMVESFLREGSRTYLWDGEIIVPMPETPSHVNSTYPENSGEFLREYAARGVPISWIVNIAGRRVEVYQGPTVGEDGTGSYRMRTDHGLDQAIPIDVAQGDVRVVGAVAVIDILCDSIEGGQ
jgi:hypothetical protein